MLILFQQQVTSPLRDSVIYEAATGRSSPSDGRKSDVKCFSSFFVELNSDFLALSPLLVEGYDLFPSS